MNKTFCRMFSMDNAFLPIHVSKVLLSAFLSEMNLWSIKLLIVQFSCEPQLNWEFLLKYPESCIVFDASYNQVLTLRLIMVIGTGNRGAQPGHKCFDHNHFMMKR